MHQAPRLVALATALLAACSSSSGSDIAECGDNCDIYGVDDRIEAHALPSEALQSSARAVGAIFAQGVLTEDDDGNRSLANPETYGDRLGLCDDVNFHEQVLGPDCTGFLIAEDLFLTAGHCLSAMPCGSADIVFDYAMGSEGQQPEVIEAKQAYRCTEVVFDAYRNGLNADADIAILRLDRAVTGREPVAMEMTSPEAGTSVFALGFPKGLPLKASPAAVQEGPFTSFYTENKAMLDAHIESVLGEGVLSHFTRQVDDALFRVDVDVFGGNSGGALIDAQSGAVMGVVVREGLKVVLEESDVIADIGAQPLDFVDDTEGDCRRPSVCEDSVECLNYPAVVPLTPYSAVIDAILAGEEDVDNDLDGVSNIDEFALGIDPDSRDSDGDFISDTEEVGFPDDPNDTDFDLLIDALEEDSDDDGIPDAEEAGDQNLDTPAIDTDGDGFPDYRDYDSDDDGIFDYIDNCRLVANPEQEDGDGDGVGDLCPQDQDGDQVPDDLDLCPQSADPHQRDTDEDGLGDACDDDQDGDGIPNATDICAEDADPAQQDTDGDGIGDACDPDRDGDGTFNGGDNCPYTHNPDQRDYDANGVGDACEDAAEAGGCNVASSGGSFAPFLLLLGLLRRRRRRS